MGITFVQLGGLCPWRLLGAKVPWEWQSSGCVTHQGDSRVTPLFAFLKSVTVSPGSHLKKD